MSFKIIDNFLSQEDFTTIKNTIINCRFPLYYSQFVADDVDNKHFYFIHQFYDKNFPLSDFVHILKPIIDKIDCKSLMRAKVNCFPRTENLITYGEHCDYEFPHKGVILYLNDCSSPVRLCNSRKFTSSACLFVGKIIVGLISFS